MGTGITELKKFLQDERKPLGNEEFMEFWKSLTDEQKEQYKAEAAG